MFNLIDKSKLSTENISQQRKAEKIRHKIHNQREKRRLEEKLMKTKGLADSDDDDIDAAKWVEKSKKLAEQKALAAKRVRLKNIKMFLMYV